ncbi:MAG: hypothetical protein M3O34_02295 [Chloroflexota bacterium]|nr:hypothetical protein [Chloroflexota bacterium]
MQMNPEVGSRVRVRPSGETGRITRVVKAADGRPTYEIEFDSTGVGDQRGVTGETGGLYVPEDVELID